MTSVTPGGTVTYTIVVTNLGPAAVVGATVVDTMPPALTGVTWTCTASSGGSCPASGTGDINALVSLPAGGSATFVVTGTVSSTAAGTLVNTASVTAPPGTVDPVSGNDSATDSDPIVASPPPPPPAAVDLAIAKAHVGTFAPGQVGAQYQITVTNVGGTATSGLVTVTDVLPAGLTATAIAGSGWSCTQTSGPCMRSDPLPPGVSYPVITLTVNVAGNPPSPLVNRVSVSGGGDVNGANDFASDEVFFGPTPGPVEPVPVDSPLALLLCALLVALAGGVVQRRRR